MIEATHLTANAYDAIILSDACESFASKCDVNFLIVIASSLIAWLVKF